ncbi:MAG: YdeI/OmpD-associated family protein [Clostridia bacterium]
MKKYEFDAEIKKQPSIDAAFIEFPYDVEKEFGVKGQVKVLATFDGCEYRGSLAKMGHNCHMLGITQKVRASIGKNPGDIVHVILKKDEEPRIVEIPEDFRQLLEENEQALGFFETLSYTNRKEYVQWITSAKKAETREKRVKDTIVMLLNKVKRT